MFLKKNSVKSSLDPTRLKKKKKKNISRSMIY